LTTSMTTTLWQWNLYTGWTASIKSWWNTMTIVYADQSWSSQKHTLGQWWYFFLEWVEDLSWSMKPLKTECSVIRPTIIYLVYPFKRFCRQIIPKTCTLFNCDFWWSK
jgi:hypothetical protein